MNQAHTQQRVAVAVSGGGRTLRNLIEQQQGRAYEISCVISSKAQSPGINLAEELGLPTLVANFGAQANPDLASTIEQWLQENRIDWIALAGFLKPFPCPAGFTNRIINIHPALLPKYGGKGMYGMHVHRAVLANKEPSSGASIHFVNEHYDEGAIIAQIRVPVGDLIDAEAIAARVFSAECQLYPETLDRLCKGALPLDHGQIFTMEP